MPIDKETLERLPYMEEGPSLDLKRAQYRFIKASDEDKSELLKDILAFANTPRDRAAHILIGVEEVKGGRNEIVGIDVNDHIDDAYLHQFVNSKTKRPVEFDYSDHTIDGKSVGVISIPIQERPVYITKDFGKVKDNTGYIRDGSSTRVASLDEIAAMGRGNPPKLQVEWGDATQRTVYPSDYLHRSTGLKLPERFRTRDGNRERYDFEALGRELNVNPAVFDRDGSHNVSMRAIWKPLGLRFYNNSGSVGENVGFTAMLGAEMAAGFDSGPSSNAPPAFLHMVNHLTDEKEIKVDVSDGGTLISVEVGHIRPKDYVWAGLGARFWTKETRTLMWKVRFVADNLPEPIECEMPLRVEYKERYIQAKDLESPFKRPDPRMLPYVE